MADYIEGQDLVKQDAYDAVLKLDKMMGDLVAKFDLVAKSAIHMQTAIGDTKGLENLTALYKKQQEEVQKVITIEKELEKTVRLKDKAIMEANLAIQEQNKQTKQTIQLNQAQEGSINQLRLQLNQATKAYDAMSKAERESGKGTTLLTNIQNTTTALKQLEANTGRFQRNVGNYTNATLQLTQVMRELPNFAQSTQIGIRSLSNNLPMLADSFGQVRKEAGGTLPALKVFASSLFTFAGIFPLVLTGLIAYSDEIINFIKGNNTAKESISELEEAFNSAVENGYTEVAVLKNLYDATQDVSKSMDERLDAVNKLQTLYPQYFGNLKDEEILAGKAKDAYLELNDALMDTIISRAYYAQADVIGKDIVKNTLMVDELSKKLSELISKSGGNKPNEFIYNRNDDTQLQGYINELQKAGGVGEELAKKLLANSGGGLYAALQKVRVELSDNIMTAESDLQRLLNIARYMYGSEVKSSKSTSAPKAPKAGKGGTDINRITALEAQYKYEQNLLDIAFKKKEIAEDEYYFKSMHLAERSQVHKAGLNAKELQSQKELNIKLEELAVDYSNKLQSIAMQKMMRVRLTAKNFSEIISIEEAEIKQAELKEKAKWMDEFIKQDLERIKDFNEKEKDETKKKTDEIKEIEAAYQQFKIDGINAFADISRTITDRIMSDIEARSTKEIEAIDLKEQAELDAIDRLTLSDSEREERKKIVELQAEARRKKIEQDKIRDLRKYALFQKGIDAGQIIANTALAVTGVIRNPSIPEPAKPFYIASYIALGTAQLAKVLATPLPQYEFGTPEGGHTGGKAIVGEAGTELGKTPDGKLFLTPSKASIMDLPKRTEIIPHDITKDLLGATMVRLAQANTAVSLDMYQDELIEAFERGTDKITKAIYKNRTNISIGGSYRDYVKSNQL
jgi:hypothetical protein